MNRHRLIFAVLLCLGAAGGQTATAPSQLGPHSGAGRGCLACHVPHQSRASIASEDETALIAQDLTPVLANLDGAAVSAPVQKTSGVQICLSCHDGVIAQAAMMQPTTFEQQIGETAATSSADIATLSETSSTTAGEHPVGVTATLGSVGVAKFFRVAKGGCTWNGVASDCLKTAASANAYRDFLVNYGAPSITSNGYSSPVEMPDENPEHAYVVCTTCHAVHTMTEFTANIDAPIAGSATGTYVTTSYVAAPYNPAANGGMSKSSSATQFCRQCHFDGPGGANEADGIKNVQTQF